MSRTEASIHVYDVMDKVQVSVRVWQTNDAEDIPATWETLAAFTFQGCGETDRRTWVSDALIAVLERL